MRYLSLLLIPILLWGCDKKSIFQGPNFYSDGFELYRSSDDLIDGQDEKWSFFQNTVEGNQILIDTTKFHSGKQSLKFVGGQTEDILSKASINKQFMAFWEGDIVSIDFWIYLAGTAPLEWLFIFDLEEQTAIGAGPGMRLALVEGKILLEHKFNNPNVAQEGNGILFPRNQWVNIRFEAELSQQKDGYVKVYQDDILIIDRENWKTLPSDFLYNTQGTQGRYSQIEFGATANPSEEDVVMYVDDVLVEVIE
ncbi:MAG: heparin lyase I family protein [Bacteroidota bacterium]